MKRNLNKQKGRWVQVPLILLLLMLCSMIQAQVTISGKVTGSGNAAASNVSVVVRNTNYGTSTDAEGAYSLSANLKPGKYVLEFSGVGFKTSTSNLTIESGKNTYIVNAELSEDVLGLDEVVVTGTGVATKKKQLGNA